MRWKRRLLQLVIISLLVFSTIMIQGCSKKTKESLKQDTQVTARPDDENKKEQPTTKKEGEEMATETTTMKSESLLPNGDFSKGSEGWAIYLESEGAADFSIQDKKMMIHITKTGKYEHSVQMYYDGFSLAKGGTYQISFEASSDIDRSIKVRPQYNGGDYHAYMEESANLTADNKKYSFEFTMMEADPAPRLCFNLGTVKDKEPYKEHQVTLSNIQLILLNEPADDESDQAKQCDIQINQIGYHKNDVKQAVLRKVSQGSSFTVKTLDGATVYEGILSDGVTNEAADEVNYYADFTELKEPGTYQIVCEGKESYPFEIKDDIYDDVFLESFRMLYYQRCGMDIVDEEGKFGHKACHTKQAFLYGTTETKEVNGGWHDAGDYGKYVVTGAIAVADLLDVYKQQEQFFASDKVDSYQIPESNNQIPDVLDEARYELTWLLKMQDKATGGVYHKVTTKSFAGFISPEDDDELLYCSPISTTATGDFAAVLAKSYGIYQSYDKEFAVKCLDAAKKAWQYLKEQDGKDGFHNPKDIVTGEYPDSNDSDERYWAAVELYRATGDREYKEYITNQIKKSIGHGYGWANVWDYGTETYLSLPEEKQDKECSELLKQSLLQRAEKILTQCKKDGYHCCLTDYCWGSNMIVCNDARLLLSAYHITKNSDYKLAAKQQLDYLLGVNAVSYCFVTGYGSHTPEHVHHRPSVIAGTTKKGMLVGGVNSHLEDSYAANVLKGVPRAKCYVDHDQSYSCNEVTIYWNSPLLVLLSAFMEE